MEAVPWCAQSVMAALSRWKQKFCEGKHLTSNMWLVSGWDRGLGDRVWQWGGAGGIRQCGILHLLDQEYCRESGFHDVSRRSIMVFYFRLKGKTFFHSLKNVPPPCEKLSSWSSTSCHPVSHVPSCDHPPHPHICCCPVTPRPGHQTLSSTKPMAAMVFWEKWGQFEWQSTVVSIWK